MRKGFFDTLVSLVLGVQILWVLTTGALALDRAPARKMRLPNGLVLVVLEDHSFPLAAVVTMVRAGTIVETKATNGSAAFLAAVMESHGSAKSPGLPFRTAIEAEGSTFESISDEETIRLETSCTPATVELNLRRQAELLLSPNLSPDAVNSVREKLLARHARRTDSPEESGYLEELCTSLAYGDHPYGLPEMDTQVVRRLTPRDLEEFRSSHVSPDAMRVAVVGDCNPDKVLAIVQELYGKLGAAGQKGPRPSNPRVSDRPRERFVNLGVRRSAVQIGFLGPTVFDEDLYPMMVIQTLLAEGQTSRLERHLVHREHLARNIEYQAKYLPSTPMFSFAFTTEPGSVEPAIQKILSEIERLRSGHVPTAELERAKTLCSTLFSLKTQKRIQQATYLARFDLFDDVALFTEMSDRIAQVSATGIIRAARRWLDPSKYVLAVIEPKERKSGKSEHIWIGKLSNGLNVIIHRDPSTSVVGVALAARVPEGAPLDQIVRSRALAFLLEKGVTKGATGEKNLEKLESVGSRIVGKGAHDGISIRANASIHNLDQVLAVLQEVVFDPSFPEHDVASVRRTLKNQLMDEGDAPETNAFARLMSTLYPSHRYGITLEAQTAAVNKLTSRDLEEDHRKLFTPPNVTLALSGNLTSAEMVPRLESLFGQIPKAPAPVDKPTPLAPALAAEIETYSQGTGDVLVMGVRMRPEARKEFPSVSVLFNILALGDDCLAVKKLEEAGILERRLSPMFSLRRTGALMVSQYLLKPGTAKRGQEILANVLRSIETGEISSAQIDATRNKIFGHFVRQFEDARIQVEHLVFAAVVLNEPDFYGQLEQAYSRVTPETVRAAVKHIEAVRYVLVTGK